MSRVKSSRSLPLRVVAAAAIFAFSAITPMARTDLSRSSTGFRILATMAASGPM